MNKTLFVTAIAALALTGCATIVSESSNPVVINSSPEQASFTVSNKAGVKVHSGQTPQTVMLDTSAGYFAKEHYTIAYQKDGYQAQSAALDAELNGWYWGNLGFGGLLGFLVIDPATGAMWQLPKRTDAVLMPSK